jgi:hypothetical protein
VAKQGHGPSRRGGQPKSAGGPGEARGTGRGNQREGSQLELSQPNTHGQGGQGEAIDSQSFSLGVDREWIETGDQASCFTRGLPPVNQSDSASDSDTSAYSVSSSSSDSSDSNSDEQSHRKVAKLISGMVKSIQKHKKAKHSKSLKKAYARQEELGATASVHVKKSVKKQVWRDEYVPLEKFLPRNTRQALQGAEKSKERAHIVSIGMWQNAFLVFSDILLERKPELARQLVAYQLNIWQIYRQEYGNVWKEYDIEFRLTLPYRPSLQWGVIDQVILSKARFEARESRRPFLKQGDSQKSPTHTYRRDVCFAYNRGSCTRSPCRYAHVCSGCGGTHAVSICSKSGNRRPGNARDRQDGPARQPLNKPAAFPSVLPPTKW